jgi:hypothetical protein
MISVLNKMLNRFAFLLQDSEDDDSVHTATAEGECHLIPVSMCIHYAVLSFQSKGT